MSELKKKSLSELRKIEHFKVGRKHYGEIEFLEPVDLSSFVNLDDIAGTLIVFASQSCVVYPDDNAPKPGEGLNLPAKISIIGSYPRNKATKMPIVDPQDEIVKRHIEQLKKLPMAFVSYDPPTGTWVFTVTEMN